MQSNDEDTITGEGRGDESNDDNKGAGDEGSVVVAGFKEAQGQQVEGYSQGSMPTHMPASFAYHMGLNCRSCSYRTSFDLEVKGK